MTLSLFEDSPPPVSPLPVNTEPWKTYGGVTLYLGDNIPILRAMPAKSVDAVVTDSPYGLGFMGKEWDTFNLDKVAANTRKGLKAHHGFNLDDARRTNPNLVGRQRSPAMSPSQIEYDRSLQGQHAFEIWCFEWAMELFRVLKPGGHLLACGAPRSAHRMVSGIEDAGFEIRDGIAWLFGQGFPKSHNLDGAWEGWGTALKPGHEPICVARKPFDGTVEENVQRWGVGALNIDRCRIPHDGESLSGGNAAGKIPGTQHEGWERPWMSDPGMRAAYQARKLEFEERAEALGRWPANVALDAQAASRLDAQAGTRKSGANPTRRSSDKFRKVFSAFKGEEVCEPARGAEEGGASRFFFCPKPSRLERDFGCDDLRHQTAGECTDRKDGSAGLTPYAGAGRSGGGRNPHPTVKPVNLMRWLVWLVTPPGGVVLDPFLGSGTTGMAAVVDGYTFIGIEKEAEYLQVADARIAATVREVSAA